jgi:phospholipase C
MEVGWMSIVARKLFAFFACGALLGTYGCGGSSGMPVTDPPVPVLPPVPAASLQHIVVVVMQNSSFDHMFGTFPAPAGGTIEGLRPGVPGYVQNDASGNPVSPALLTNLAPKALPEGRAAYTNVMDGGLMDKYAFYNGDISMDYYDGTTAGISTIWSYAQQFAMADHYFSSVIGEAPSNQLFMIAASDGNFPFSVQPSYGPCNTADKAARPLTFPNVGDQLTQKGVSWAVYLESMGVCTDSSPLHNPFQYFTSTQGQNARDYTQFSTDVAGGTLPAVSFVIPNNTDDMHPGFGPVTNGAAFIDTLVKKLQATTMWSNTAVIVTWDTGGGWYDHVPPPQVDAEGLGSRVPLLVISPLAKQHYVSHIQMDHVSILKFIQKNWALAPLNSRNSLSNDLSDLFQ